ENSLLKISSSGVTVDDIIIEELKNTPAYLNFSSLLAQALIKLEKVTDNTKTEELHEAILALQQLREAAQQDPTLQGIYEEVLLSVYQGTDKSIADLENAFFDGANAYVKLPYEYPAQNSLGDLLNAMFASNNLWNGLKDLLPSTLENSLLKISSSGTTLDLEAILANNPLKKDVAALRALLEKCKASSSFDPVLAEKIFTELKALIDKYSEYNSLELQEALGDSEMFLNSLYSNLMGYYYLNYPDSLQEKINYYKNFFSDSEKTSSCLPPGFKNTLNNSSTETIRVKYSSFQDDPTGFNTYAVEQFKLLLRPYNFSYDLLFFEQQLAALQSSLSLDLTEIKDFFEFLDYFTERYSGQYGTKIQSIISALTGTDVQNGYLMTLVNNCIGYTYAKDGEQSANDLLAYFKQLFPVESTSPLSSFQTELNAIIPLNANTKDFIAHLNNVLLALDGLYAYRDLVYDQESGQDLLNNLEYLRLIAIKEPALLAKYNEILNVLHNYGIQDPQTWLDQARAENLTDTNHNRNHLIYLLLVETQSKTDLKKALTDLTSISPNSTLKNYLNIYLSGIAVVPTAEATAEAAMIAAAAAALPSVIKAVYAAFDLEISSIVDSSGSSQQLTGLLDKIFNISEDLQIQLTYLGDMMEILAEGNNLIAEITSGLSAFITFSASCTVDYYQSLSDSDKAKTLELIHGFLDPLYGNADGTYADQMSLRLLAEKYGDVFSGLQEKYDEIISTLEKMWGKQDQCLTWESEEFLEYFANNPTAPLTYTYITASSTQYQIKETNLFFFVSNLFQNVPSDTSDKRGTGINSVETAVAAVSTFFNSQNTQIQLKVQTLSNTVNTAMSCIKEIWQTLIDLIKSVLEKTRTS
ncbi:MAG: hypothetical protein WC371_01490, partial [Parachlamydiales bacterium]